MRLADVFEDKCAKCPYTLGYVKFVKCPCPECKLDNYGTYYRLLKGRYAYMEAEKEDGKNNK